MKRLTLLLLFLTAFCYSSAELFSTAEINYNIDEMLNDYPMQMRQKPGTEELLKDYLSEIDAPNDTLFALLYSPMACPRCEGLFIGFFESFKKLVPQYSTVLISVGMPEKSAKAYNERNRFVADYYIYDTEERYKNIFSFNTFGQVAPVLLKVCKTTGRTIVCGDYHYISDDYVYELVNFKDPIPMLDYELSHSPLQLELPDAEPKGYSDRMLAGDFNISVADSPLEYDGDYFFFNDRLAEGVALYKADGNKPLRFVTLFQADSTERRRFVEVDDKTYEHGMKSGMFRFMALMPKSIGNGEMGISYSLPHLWDVTETRVGYRNEAVILTRNLQTLQPGNMVVFSSDFITSEFFYKHFTFGITNDKVLLACEKITWPMEVEPSEYRGNTYLDPFDDRFYDTPNPYMAIFDRKTGNLVTRFGKLSECHRKSLTGYSFVVPEYDVLGREVAYTDGFSGEIHICNIDEPEKTTADFSAFRIDCSQFPEPDTTLFSKLDYIKPYQKFFYRHIIQVKLTEKSVGCIIKHSARTESASPDDRYTFVVFDRKTGKKTETLLPVYDDLTILGRGLKNENGTVKPFVLLRDKDDNCFVRMFK